MSTILPTNVPTRPILRPARCAQRWLLAVVLCVAAPPVVNAGTDGADAAQRVVQDATERFFAAIEQQRERVHDLDHAHALVEEYISPHVDTEYVARLILGRHWRTASDEQRARFIDAFTWMLLRSYSIAVEDLSGVEIDYLPPRGGQRDGEAEVRTRISRRGGPPVGVDYRMRQRDGEWLVFDLSIQGVSMVATYRGTFASQINRHGLDGLIERIGQQRADSAGTRSSG